MEIDDAIDFSWGPVDSFVFQEHPIDERRLDIISPLMLLLVEQLLLLLLLLLLLFMIAIQVIKKHGSMH
jgi:hypothetical protein